MSLEAGALVGNKIRLIRPLKRGGMGSVWLAEHQTLRMQVAVKFMAEQLAQDPEYVERFSREAMASAQIKSPHVVQVFDHGIAGSMPYIVMELLEGEDLRTRIARSGPLPLGDAAAIIVQLTRALAKAHAAGIVHRDIKPDNIFLVEHDGEPFVKVLDFGVAKHAAQETEFSVTGTGAMVGTPHYMSPEQILSARRVDHRADLWSIGVVMYRALTGAVPFSGETLGAVCVAIERGMFIPPTSRRPELPLTLDSWFLRALARDPSDRFQSAKEMAEAFVSAVEAGGYSMNAFYRPEISSHGGSIPPPRSLAGFSAPPPPAAPWTTTGTNPAMSLSGVSVPTQVTVQQRTSFLSTPPPSGQEPAWLTPAAPQAPAQPQTFPGATVTHVEPPGPSRRLLITAASISLGMVVVVTVLVVMLVGKSDPPPSAAAIESSTSDPAIAQAPTVVVQPTTQATAPVDIATAEPTAEPVATTKSAPVVKPNPTVKPRRDRGF